MLSCLLLVKIWDSFPKYRTLLPIDVTYNNVHGSGQELVRKDWNAKTFFFLWEQSKQFLHFKLLNIKLT